MGETSATNILSTSPCQLYGTHYEPMLKEPPCWCLFTRQIYIVQPEFSHQNVQDYLSLGSFVLLSNSDLRMSSSS